MAALLFLLRLNFFHKKEIGGKVLLILILR